MNKDTYSIKELEILSQIKSPTIRAWERRYNLLHPTRTETNIRFYDSDDLRKLLQIVFLKNAGYKVSKIADLSQEECTNLCNKEIFKNENSSSSVFELLIKVAEKDVDGFEKLYDHYLENSLHSEFIIDILEPLIDKIKNLWLSQKIDSCFEIYMLNRIFVKTLVAAEKERKQGRQVNEILIFQSDKDVFPINLSLVYFLAAVKNYKIHYFFNPVSLKAIKKFKGMYEPDIVYTEFNEKTAESLIEDYCNTIEDVFPASKNIISGKIMSKNWKKIPNKVYYIRSLNVLNQTL
ncbi:MAG TPA: MerR family transcriptional regulator [Bacteroidales bacterium]|nr:MerR family transcriptional regulator [Bacteroidales bacterium]